MSAFSQWLMAALSAMVQWLYNSAIDLIQYVSDTLADFALSIVSLFPAGSSMPSLPAPPTGGVFVAFLQTLNWIFPIAFMVQLVQWVALGMVAYLVIAPLARWAKLLT